MTNIKHPFIPYMLTFAVVLAASLPCLRAVGAPRDDEQYLVFAHYMPCFKAYAFSKDDNYWFDEGFAPSPGHRGGLSARPIVYPVGQQDPQLDAIVSDIRLAKTYGIDGFLVDELDNTPGYDAEWRMLLKGAEIVGGFKIGIMPDYATLYHKGTAGREAAIKDWLDLGANSPALLRYNDKPVVFPYGDGFPDGRDKTTHELISVEEKANIVDALQSQGIDIAYAPNIGIDWPVYKAPYANDPQGGFQTYSFTVGSFSPMAPDYKYDAALTYWPSTVMITGEDAFLYYNRGWRYSTGREDLSQYYRQHWAWNIEHRDRVHWIMLVTWNDWGETAIAPSVNHFMAWQPITRYYADWFKTGTQPKIDRDTIEIFHRPHPFAATPTVDPFDVAKDPKFQLDAPNDVVEALAFLTAPATLVIHSGNKVYRQTVAAGVQSVVRPFALGVQSAAIERNSKIVAYVVSPVPITGSPARQNLWYIGADSSHPPRDIAAGVWTNIGGNWTGTETRRGIGMSIGGDPLQLGDCSISAKLAARTASDGSTAGVVAHSTADGLTYYGFMIASAGGKSVWQLTKVVKGVETILSSGPLAGDPDASHTLRLDCVGEYKIGYVDGDLVTQVSDYPVMADYQLAFGQGGISATGTPASFSQITIHSYDPDLTALNSGK